MADDAGAGDVAAVASAAATTTAEATAAAAKPLLGRVAIVTGASRGIGRAIATHLSALGASVVLGYASPSRAAEADAFAASLPRPAVAVRADVSDEESGARSLFDAAEASFGGAHILVANAGVNDGGYPAVADTATESFDRIVAVNLRGAFLCLREAANRLVSPVRGGDGGGGGGGGRIVAVTSSVVGSNPAGYGAYTASKAAVEALVRTMAKELGGRITANCVAPGATATDMFFDGKSEEMVRRAAETNPMKRLGEAGDIAPLVGFLCTDAAGWINGQVIRANGGYV